MKSKITGGETKKIFSAKILNKYDIDYFKCLDTGFIQTEEPYWLEDAYSSAITKLDLGLASRNEILSSLTMRLLNHCFKQDARFLDYAGGYGLFTRLMRDKGFNFYHTDKFCLNMFAEYFDLKDIGEDSKFELLTAFEVFEHMTDPMKEISEITKYSDNIFFSTELQPGTQLRNVQDWWYFIPETGQHVSLYTAKALEYIAKYLGYNFYTDEGNYHLFTKKDFKINPFHTKRDPFFIRKMRKIIKSYDAANLPERRSLIHQDYDYVKTKLS